jgi:hypothetical protein
MDNFEKRVVMLIPVKNLKKLVLLHSNKIISNRNLCSSFFLMLLTSWL